MYGIGGGGDGEKALKLFGRHVGAESVADLGNFHVISFCISSLSFLVLMSRSVRTTGETDPLSEEPS